MIGEKTLSAIFHRFPRINPDYIIFGQGEMERDINTIGKAIVVEHSESELENVIGRLIDKKLNDIK